METPHALTPAYRFGPASRHPRCPPDTLQILYLDATFQTADTVCGTLIYDLNYHFIIGANVTSTGLYNTTWTSAYSTPDSHGSSSIEVYNQSASPYLGLNFVIEYTGFTPAQNLSEVTSTSG